MVKTKPAYGGKECPADEKKDCSTDYCPVPYPKLRLYLRPKAYGYSTKSLAADGTLSQSHTAEAPHHHVSALMVGVGAGVGVGVLALVAVVAGRNKKNAEANTAIPLTPAMGNAGPAASL